MFNGGLNMSKRNTSKEKMKDNKHFPYRNMDGQRKYRIVDESGNSYGEFVSHQNALNEIKRQEKLFFRFGLLLEHLK